MTINPDKSNSPIDIHYIKGKIIPWWDALPIEVQHDILEVFCVFCKCEFSEDTGALVKLTDYDSDRLFGKIIYYAGHVDLDTYLNRLKEDHTPKAGIQANTHG